MTLDYPIRTPSLLLRPYVEDDFEDFARWAGDAEITRYLLWGPRDRVAAREAFDKRVANGELAPHRSAHPLVITLPDGRFVGEASIINLDHPQRKGEIGYMIRPEFAGCGFASEAARAMLALGFDTLGFHRMTGSCDDRNLASARVMEKLGMRREAHHLSTWFSRGEWSGGFVYAMLEDEWRARR